MKIAFFETQKEEEKEIKMVLHNHELLFFQNPITAQDILKINSVEILSPFIYSKIEKKVIDQLPFLKFIATRSTGYDHIDIVACKKKGILVSNVPVYGENTVAEHTFALILALSRKIHQAYIRTLGLDFSIRGLQGFDLKDKTLGVIGTGHIGEQVIRIAKGFAMKVIAYDLYPKKPLAKNLSFQYVPLKQIFTQSDIITLHIPYTKKNHHLINKSTLARCKKGSIIINTSRGELLDTAALLQALSSDHIAGAGLDVIEGETMIKEEQQVFHKIHQQTIKQRA